jgi:hypothetical protein
VPPASPKPQSCTGAYALTAGSALIGKGVDIQATLGVLNPNGIQLNPVRDYFGNATPNGVLSGWNIGADGGHH